MRSTEKRLPTQGLSETSERSVLGSPELEGRRILIFCSDGPHLRTDAEQLGHLRRAQRRAPTRACRRPVAIQTLEVTSIR